MPLIADPEIVIAEQIARRVHARQARKLTGEPVLRHVQRVVARIETGRPEHVTAVAWLHDVMERSNLTARALLAEGISPEVVEAVGLLTRSDHETYAAYIERIRASRNALAITVKIADLHDHLGPDCAPAKRSRYERALKALDALAVRP